MYVLVHCRKGMAQFPVMNALGTMLPALLYSPTDFFLVITGNPNTVVSLLPVQTVYIPNNWAIKPGTSKWEPDSLNKKKLEKERLRIWFSDWHHIFNKIVYKPFFTYFYSLDHYKITTFRSFFINPGDILYVLQALRCVTRLFCEYSLKF